MISFFVTFVNVLTSSQTTSAEMATQLLGRKKAVSSDATELRLLAAPAASAERHLNNAWNQLVAAEVKVVARITLESEKGETWR